MATEDDNTLDAFTEFCEKDEATRREQYQSVIDDRIERCGEDRFTESCQSFLRRAGFLTEGQLEALSVDPPRRDNSRYSDWDDPYDIFREECPDVPNQS